ncbi:hypothetical protein HK405_013970, partial [Cladochytrium tenue]
SPPLSDLLPPAPMPADNNDGDDAVQHLLVTQASAVGRDPALLRRLHAVAAALPRPAAPPQPPPPRQAKQLQTPDGPVVVADLAALLASLLLLCEKAGVDVSPDHWAAAVGPLRRSVLPPPPTRPRPPQQPAGLGPPTPTPPSARFADAFRRVAAAATAAPIPTAGTTSVRAAYAPLRPRQADMRVLELLEDAQRAGLVRSSDRTPTTTDATAAAAAGPPPPRCSLAAVTFEPGLPPAARLAGLRTALSLLRRLSAAGAAAAAADEASGQPASPDCSAADAQRREAAVVLALDGAVLAVGTAYSFDSGDGDDVPMTSRRRPRVVRVPFTASVSELEAFVAGAAAAAAGRHSSMRGRPGGAEGE